MENPRVHELIYSEDTVQSVAQELYTCMAHAQVFTFQGDLGAGKTTLIQVLLQEAGISDPAPSPTYSYLNTYTNARGETIYHFDLYRLSSLQDFYDAGFHEYLYVPCSWAFIEWPEIVMDILTHNVCQVVLYHYGYERRRLRYMCY